MRSVLTLALNALALLSLFVGGRELARIGQPSSSDEAMTILIGSQGHLLPAAPRPGSQERLDKTIAVGDLILNHQVKRRGLMVATLRPGLAFESFLTVDAAEDPEAAATLSRLVESLPIGSVIAAATSGRVHPAPELLEALDAFPRALGAELSPFRAPAASWALISYHLESGWRTIAEAYSEERAVNLAYTLTPDPRDYEAYRSEVYFERSDGAEVVDLYSAFADASVRKGELGANRAARAGGVRAPSISMRPTKAEPARIIWEQVSIPAHTTLVTGFSQVGPRAPGQSPPRFSVHVDGVEIGFTSPDSIGPTAWIPWSVNLGDTPRRGATLELRTEVAEGDLTYNWGRPLLNWKEIE